MGPWWEEKKMEGPYGFIMDSHVKLMELEPTIFVWFLFVKDIE